MKNNQIVAGLTGIFVVCAAFTFWNVWNFHASLKELGVAQGRVAFLQGTMGPTMHALLNDTTDYSKKNPAVLPILQALTNEMSHFAAPKPATAK